MIFNEIYGAYYKTITKAINLAINGELTSEKLESLIKENAFSESSLAIRSAIKDKRWQILNDDYTTPIQHTSSLPITILEKRWLKSITLDARFKLFNIDIEGLEDIKPLFTEKDYLIFDKYADGDPFEEEEYISTFHKILKAINNKNKLDIKCYNKKGILNETICSPLGIEYSEKNDKFRLLISKSNYGRVINISRIEYCEVLDEKIEEGCNISRGKRDNIVLELVDERQALERVMLHFAHFEKQAEKIADNKYKIQIYYDVNDETEMVIRVLSFGPLIKVIKPYRFLKLIKERLVRQKSCNLK